MKNKRLSNRDIALWLRFWYSPLTTVFSMAQENVLATYPITGELRKTERANLMHATLRKGMSIFAESAECFFQLVEEPEGQGMDYLKVVMGDKAFGVRWGKYDGVRINRNSTMRQQIIQEQGFLFPELCQQEDEVLKVVTLGYTIEDDFTLGGFPQWYVGRVALIQESAEQSEFIENVAIFQKVDRQFPPEYISSPRAVAWRQQCDELRRSIDEIRRRIA